MAGRSEGYLAIFSVERISVDLAFVGSISSRHTGTIKGHLHGVWVESNHFRRAERGFVQFSKDTRTQSKGKGGGKGGANGSSCPSENERHLVTKRMNNENN